MILFSGVKDREKLEHISQTHNCYLAKIYLNKPIIEFIKCQNGMEQSKLHMHELTISILFPQPLFDTSENKVYHTLVIWKYNK